MARVQAEHRPGGMLRPLDVSRWYRYQSSRNSYVSVKQGDSEQEVTASSFEVSDQLAVTMNKTKSQLTDSSCCTLFHGTPDLSDRKQGSIRGVGEST